MVTISMFDQIKPNYLKSYAETHFNKEVELKHFLLTFICIRSGSRYGTQGHGAHLGRLRYYLIITMYFRYQSK